MTLTLAFSASSHLLTALGLAVLAVTDEVSWVYLAAAMASLACSAVGEMRQGRGFLPVFFANAAMAVIFALVLVSIFVFKALPLQELAHFLLALQSVKLLSDKKGRDWLQLYLLSFFSLIAATALSVEVSTAAIFAFYLLWGPWVLVLFHLRYARPPGDKTADARGPWPLWPLFRMIAGMSGVLLLLTLFFFVALPRFGSGYLGELWASGAAMTGFSDRLALGEIASIKRNSATAMRVRVDRPDLLGRRALYWRGIALDRFDGRKWERSKTASSPLRPTGTGYLLDDKGSSRGPFVRQEILLEPTGSPALFFLGRPISFTGSLRGPLRDSLGNLRLIFPPPFQISYEVLSDLNGAPKDELSIETFLQLPEVDARIAALAQRITEDVHGELQQARALEKHLRETYRYSLEDLPTGSEDPLALFLFQVGHGDCEYFSSALAIMLRQIGIPTRVVNGYLGGEWNSYGEYYLVQQSHAHSWVEAYLPGEGWTVFDATPAGPMQRSFLFLTQLSDFVDYLRLRWYRYVINFGLQDQYSLFAALTRPYSWLHGAPSVFSARGAIGAIKTWGADPNNWILMVLIGLCIAIAQLSLNGKKKRALSPDTHSQAARRYQRFLKLAEKRGFKKKPGQTADEFTRTTGKLGVGLVEEFTALYQKARFRGPPIEEADLRKMDRILAELRR